LLCSRLKKKKQRRTTKQCRGSSQFPARPIMSNPFIVALPINFRLPPSSSSLHHHHQPSSPTSSRPPRMSAPRLTSRPSYTLIRRRPGFARPAASTVAFRPFLLLTDLRAVYIISGAWKNHTITTPITIQWPGQSNGRSIDEQLRRWRGVGVHPPCLPDRFCNLQIVEEAALLPAWRGNRIN